jgi:acetyl esterase/lipase
MLTSTIPLREDSDQVYLEIYVLKDSPEFQTGIRRPAVILCPGGGYMMTSDREAEPVALRFLARGYHVFVLRYSVQTRFPEPMLDLARAILMVRARAAAWLVDPDQITLCGFSAGGHLAASLGVLWDKPMLTEPLGASADQIRPNALILGYPVIDLELVANHRMTREPEGTDVGIKDHILSLVLGPDPAPSLREQYCLDLQVSAATPPTFIWHTAEDELVFAQNALRFAMALAEHRVPYELHVFERGRHGLSLADETTDVDQQMINRESQVWIDLALSWLLRRREQAAEIRHSSNALPA